MHPSDITNDLLIERLFVEDSARMWRAVLAYTGDPEIASDSVAEAFTLALESQDRISHASGGPAKSTRARGTAVAIAGADTPFRE